MICLNSAGRLGRAEVHTFVRAFLLRTMGSFLHFGGRGRGLSANAAERPAAGRDGSNSPESSLSVRRGNGLSTGHARRSKRRAPFAFKESTIRSAIHTTFLAVGCVLHRCASLEIHRAEHNSPFNQSEWTRSFRCKRENYRSRGRRSMMILPQVHLRKPCYDFYFL